MSNPEDTQLHRAAGESVQFEAMDRSSFLLKGALATAALYGAAAVTPVVRSAFAQNGKPGDGGAGPEVGGSGDEGGPNDVAILNFAYTLELLEATFYEEALARVDLGGGQLRSLAEEIASNERDHADGLSKMITDLGGKPAKEPGFSFPLSDQGGFLELAVTFEDTGVSAYNGAGPLLNSQKLLAYAGSIAQIEGRHAAAVREMNGQESVIQAFDITLEMDEVLNMVDPFITS